MNARHFFGFSGSIVALLAACHTPGTPPIPAKTAFDPAAFPAGTGWFCYRAIEGYDAKPCERSKETCDALQKKDVNAKSECTKLDVAYCFSVNDPAKPRAACYGQERECQNASNVQPPAGSPSECGTVK